MTDSFITLEIIGSLTLFASIIFIIGMKYGKNKSLPNIYSDFAITVPSYVENRIDSYRANDIYERLVSNDSNYHNYEDFTNTENPDTEFEQYDTSNFLKTNITPRMTIVNVSSTTIMENYKCA